MRDFLLRWAFGCVLAVMVMAVATSIGVLIVGLLEAFDSAPKTTFSVASAIAISGLIAALFMRD